MPTPDTAVRCPTCGGVLDASGAAGRPRPMTHTIVGIVGAEAGPSPAASRALDSATAAPEAAGEPSAAQTVVGLRPPHAPVELAISNDNRELLKTRVGFQAPGQALGTSIEAVAPATMRTAPPGQEAAAPPTLKDPSAGLSVSDANVEGAVPEQPSRMSGYDEWSSRDSRPRASNQNGVADELGATLAPAPMHFQVFGKRMRAHALEIPRPVLPYGKEDAGRAKRAKPSRRKEGAPGQITRLGVAIVGAAVALALGAVIFVALWPGAPKVTAHPRTDAQGREIVELLCPSCPDDTTLSVGQASAEVSGKLATVQLAAPLPVGESTLKVRIDRPGGGRDETVPVRAVVAYRVRSDLSTLQGERPAVQVIIEAARGARVALDGRLIPLTAGKATETIDVTESCVGLTDEIKSLSLQIPYTVTPEDGQAERGTVSVMVGIVPLSLLAPGPNVIIDGPSFVLAGRTVKGAELYAAGKPIPVKPDGSFAHVMNVSSIGATQIEVRAKLAGMAPRITRIRVRRVDSLETAAREFAAENPISYAVLAADGARQTGKPIMLAGQVLEVRRENHQTIMLLDAGVSSGCEDCRVQLVQGADNPVQVGDQITAYGRVLSAPPVTAAPSVPGQVPEVQVDFTVKGLR